MGKRNPSLGGVFVFFSMAFIFFSACYVVPKGVEAGWASNVVAAIFSILGILALVCGVTFALVWMRCRMIGRYEWIYEMPDGSLQFSAEYDDSRFRSSVNRYRMKVGGWWKTSRRMTTPYEGEAIDHYLSYDGDGDMTITFHRATFTVPASVAIEFLRKTHGNDFNRRLTNLMYESDRLVEVDQEKETLRKAFLTMVNGISSEGSKRASKQVIKFRDEVVAKLIKDLPLHNSMRDDLLAVDDGLAEVLADIDLNGDGAQPEPTVPVQTDTASSKK